MPNKNPTSLEEESDVLEQPSIIMLPQDNGPKFMRTIGLIGDVNEEKAGEIIHGLITLKQYGKIEQEEQEETKKKKKAVVKDEYEPIEFYLSTNGGSASDMFAIYDVMRMVRKDCEIHTVGIGKVMSAGVLLLAAGTKGKRKIGKNCRVMIHSVLAGSEGPLHNLENEMNEIRWTQERYIKALIEESKLTQTTMNKLLQKHVNIYLSAEEAVKYGLADEVV